MNAFLFLLANSPPPRHHLDTCREPYFKTREGYSQHVCCSYILNLLKVSWKSGACLLFLVSYFYVCCRPDSYVDFVWIQVFFVSNGTPPPTIWLSFSIKPSSKAHASIRALCNLSMPQRHECVFQVCLPVGTVFEMYVVQPAHTLHFLECFQRSILHHDVFFDDLNLFVVFLNLKECRVRGQARSSREENGLPFSGFSPYSLD